MTGGDLSSRHSLSVDGIENANEVTPMTVRITLAQEWAASPAGQLLATCLVNLLVRQVGIVGAIELEIPDARLKVWLPCTVPDRALGAALKSLASWATGDRVRVSCGTEATKADLVIAIGAAPGTCDECGRKAVYVYGCGWRAWIGVQPLSETVSGSESSNPLGPFLAAALVAGEVFKHCRGLGKFLMGNGYSLWTGETASSWCGIDDGPELQGRTLQPIHVIGAGAVGNDIAYVLACACLADAYVIVIDDDFYDWTNLNRCLLAGVEDLQAGERPAKCKVSSVSAQLERASVLAYAFEGTVRDYVLAPKPGLRADVALSLEFPIVLSCVDRAVSRHDIQGLWPRLLLDGSTLGLRAKTNAYRLREGAPCLACHERTEDDAAKVRAFEARLRNMPEEERRAFLEEKGLNTAAIESYFRDPSCGSEGEAELKSFATRTEPQFSVGFVSLGASLLLASSLFRRALFAHTAPARMDMTALNFLNGGMADAGSARDENCQLKCAARPVG